MPTMTAPEPLLARAMMPQEVLEMLDGEKEKNRASYQRNKEKIRLRDQARRTDPERYDRMKELSKLWNRKRYQEAKHEDYECECGARIKRVSLHSHVLTKKHLKAVSE
jgi:hypothetical protein